jgi:hypothetical protein
VNNHTATVQQPNEKSRKSGTDNNNNSMNNQHVGATEVKQQQEEDTGTPILIFNNMKFNRHEPCEIPCEYTTDPTRRKAADASVYERRGYRPPHPDDKFAIYL